MDWIKPKKQFHATVPLTTVSLFCTRSTAGGYICVLFSNGEYPEECSSLNM